MAKPPQLVAVALALVVVLSSAGYGIARGVTAKDYTAYNECIKHYSDDISARVGFGVPPMLHCLSYLPDYQP